MFMAFDFSVSAVVETALIDQLEVGTRAYQQKHVHRRKSYINSRESSPHSPKEISKRKNNWKLSFLVESKYVDRHWYILWAIWNSNRILDTVVPDSHLWLPTGCKTGGLSSDSELIIEIYLSTMLSHQWWPTRYSVESFPDSSSFRFCCFQLKFPSEDKRLVKCSWRRLA